MSYVQDFVVQYILQKGQQNSWNFFSEKEKCNKNLKEGLWEFHFDGSRCECMRRI